MVSILETKKTLEEVLLQREEIIGVGISPDEQHIRIYVLQDEYDKSIPDIPRRMAGYEIDIVPIPGFVTLDAADYRSKRFRPVVGGVSAAHASVSAGTIGSVIRDKKTGNKLFLSNNHVFANTASRTNFRGHVGDAIIQPGSADGGSIADTVATLYKWVPFNDNGTNLVDAALAFPVSQDIASPYILADDKLRVISINGVRSITSPIKVKKYGRTSGADWGEVLDWNFTVAVDFDDGRARNFVDQILIAIETRGGDSGAILLDSDNNAVGLVFAGGIDKSGKWYGVANKIRNVLAMFSDNDVDISDGWNPSHAMIESPPQFEIESTSIDADQEPVVEENEQDHTLRNIAIAGVGLAAAVALWEGLNTDKI